MRHALVIEYDGGAYHGWQRQPGTQTVQGCVETALTRVGDSPIAVTCAGRTDTGVHATAQVVHFDTEAVRRLSAWRLGVNANLPATISVLWAGTPGDGFHARYSAVERTYRYVIENRRSRSSLCDGRAWWLHQSLDIGAMRAAARHLIGEHDFSAFRASSCQARTPNRFIASLDIDRLGDYVVVTINANAFLHNMVRIIVGMLVAIGTGEHEPQWAGRLLAGRERVRGAATAPAHGLYLTAVRYASAHRIPSQRNTLPMP